MYKEKQSIKLSENAGIKQTRNHFEENEFLVFFFFLVSESAGIKQMRSYNSLQQEHPPYKSKKVGVH